MERKIKRGDVITLQKSFKNDGTIKGRVKALKERPGYLTVKWVDGRESHVNCISQCIVAINGRPVGVGVKL